MTKKALIHTGNKCGGEYSVENTEEGLPYLVCVICGHKQDDWIKWHQEYQHYWKDAAKWENKRNQVVCLLGYFANLYQKHYGVDLALSLNDRGLFRGAEAHHIRKLLLNCGNAESARAYLDWVFDTKVKQRKKKITSLGFLNTEALINEFNLAQKKKKMRTRSTALPPGMLRWLEANAPKVLDLVSLKDFGDLHTLLTHYRKGHLRDTPDVVIYMGKLLSSGVIDQDFGIVNWSE